MKKLIYLLIFILFMISHSKAQFKILSCEITANDSLEISFRGNPIDLKKEDFKFSNPLAIKSLIIKKHLILLNTSEIDLSETYTIQYKNGPEILLEPGRVLDKFDTDKKLGWAVVDGRTTFNLFAPRANMVKLVLFDHFADEDGKEYFLSKEDDGVWTLTIPQELWGKYYAYRIFGPQNQTELFNPEILVADPYSRTVAIKNSFENDARSFIYKENKFDWENTDYINIKQDNLVIYETHVRDLTAHSSSGVKQAGTYLGFIDPTAKGGLNYLKQLGINAVELLPIHEFQNWEIPFNKEHRGFFNTWNPYQRNHWGYMTTFFFAPESYYASDGKINLGQWNGTDGRVSSELKQMIKTLHKEGIAVILDVVYNHVSQYDFNPFKMIDKKYYFRLDSNMNFISQSGCGNDFKTERPMSRKMILESVKYWLEEYKVDGFRFDLAYLIDKETCKLILEEAKKINPNAFIIAEPWGGGYDPAGFSEINWAAWNDKARNGIKGQNPFTRKGFIFGEWDENVDIEMVRNFILGTLKEYDGLFQNSTHAINYLESHDDNTMGDFIRLGINKVTENQVIKDPKKVITLTKQELKLHKLAAMMLFSLQGPIMIHSGQEYARSKIIAPTDVPDTNVGRIDHNSYNKDNETNYINYEHVAWNNELVKYYQGLITLRKKYSFLSKNEHSNINFIYDKKNPFFIGFTTKSNSDELLIMFNADKKILSEITLPTGKWTVLADGNKVYDKKDKLKIIEKSLKLNSTEGLILLKQKSTK